MAGHVERRLEVYSKALDVFIQKGYSGTSISMIAKALGMSKANLYHYCSSKEDLFFKVHLDGALRANLLAVETPETVAFKGWRRCGQIDTVEWAI